MRLYRALFVCVTGLFGIFFGVRAAQAKNHANTPRNVLGGPLEVCCIQPMTGFFRDGSCRATPQDPAMHTVCALVDERFLKFTAQRGNDLSTARPGFIGLKPGDRWCLCASRWLEAQKEGAAPKVVIAATDEAALQVIGKELLLQHAAATSP